MSTRKQILALLADGRFHSGTEIGENLGISRAAVHKAIKTLICAGVEIHRVQGRGYRQLQPRCPLKRTEILGHLGEFAAGYADRLHLLEETDSTSNYLNALAATDNIAGAVCIAESQSGGRGRRGRSWVATPYSNILMSMAWNYDDGPAVAAGLSLAAGVSVVDSLEEFGIEGAGLKWPNDVLLRDRKLAGLLLDVHGEMNGPTRVILGLGINVYLGERDAADIDQPWIDLNSVMDNVIDRNRLVAILIRRLQSMFNRYQETGLEGFADRWRQVHLYEGKSVRVFHGEHTLEGVVAGIDGSGAIRLRDAGGNLRSYHSGEITLRTHDDATAD